MIGRRSGIDGKGSQSWFASFPRLCRSHDHEEPPLHPSHEVDFTTAYAFSAQQKKLGLNWQCHGRQAKRKRENVSRLSSSAQIIELYVDDFQRGYQRLEVKFREPVTWEQLEDTPAKQKCRSVQAAGLAQGVTCQWLTNPRRCRGDEATWPTAPARAKVWVHSQGK